MLDSTNGNPWRDRELSQQACNTLQAVYFKDLFSRWLTLPLDDNTDVYIQHSLSSRISFNGGHTIIWVSNCLRPFTYFPICLSINFLLNPPWWKKTAQCPSGPTQATKRYVYTLDLSSSPFYPTQWKIALLVHPTCYHSLWCFERFQNS